MSWCNWRARYLWGDAYDRMLLHLSITTPNSNAHQSCSGLGELLALLG